MAKRWTDSPEYRRANSGVGMGIACPRCGSTNTYWQKRRRGWTCRKCGQDFDAQFKKLRRLKHRADKGRKRAKRKAG